MNNNDLIVRTYKDAAFIMNRKDWSSIFFEGTISSEVSKLIENPLCKPPKNPDLKQDFLLLKKYIHDFLVEDNNLSQKTVVSPATRNSIDTLCQYARQKWQVINASIELLSLCNQNCQHCYWGKLDNKGLDFKNIKSLAESLKEAGVIFILLTGGETFIRPDILEILACLDELKFAVEIKTNGSLIKQKVLDFLSQKRIYDLQVSIYEIKDGYSVFTRSRYDFSKVSENVNSLISVNVPVSISVTVGNHNIDEIRHWHEKLQISFGERVSIFYSPYITPKRNGLGEEKNLRLSKRDLKEKFLPFLEEINGFPSVEKYRDCSSENAACYAGRDQIVIDPNGNIHPCLDLRLEMGNIQKEPLSEILNKRRQLLNGFSIKNIPKCQSCSLIDYCDSCIGIALIENGDYRKPVEHKCDITHLYNHRRIKNEKIV